MRNKFTLYPLPLVLPEKEVSPRTYHFLLGANDREMRRIRQILGSLGFSYSNATHNGSLVHPGNAYQADPISVPPGTILVMVECGLSDLTGCEGCVLRRIDHHNLNDEGYHMSAEQFWAASSLGQMYTLLRLGTPTKEDLIIAARDHCMADAMQGKCPGISPADVMLYSLQSIAEEQGVSMLHVEAEIRSMRREIRRAPIVTIGNQNIADVRHIPAGIGYSLMYLSIREALAQDHQAGLVKSKNDEHGPDKVLMCGATPSAIEDFWTSWGPAQGLTKFFYVPARGYAGGFQSK